MDGKLIRLLILFFVLCPVVYGQMLQAISNDQGSCSPASGHIYITSFPLTEAPVSECSSWTNGGTYGWNNINTSANLAYGTQAGSANDFKDSTALLVGTWGNDQQISFTIKNAAPNVTTQEEIEARLRSSLASNNSTGYEADFIISPTTDCSAQFVRWNGTVGNFTVISPGGTSMTCPITGDTMTARAIGTNLSLYNNGLLLNSWTDSTYTSGQPGMGSYFWTNGGGGAATDFGQTSMRFTDKPLHSVAHTSKDNTSTAVALTALNTTGATEIVVVVYWASTTVAISSCTGSTSGALTAITGPTTINGTYRMEIFHKDNPTTGASDAITCTMASGSRDIGAAETAIMGVSALDQSQSIHAASGTTASATTTGTTTALDEYLVGACVLSGSQNTLPTAQWNQLENANFGGNQFYDGISVKLQTIAFSMGQTPTGTYGCWAGTFK